MNHSWSLQDFDTDLFGFKVAKITHIDDSGDFQDILKRIDLLFEEFRKNQVEYATYRLSAGNFSLIHALERSGFLLVDGLLTLQLETKDINSEQSLPFIRKATLKDLNRLKSLSSTVFALTRFYTDPFIKKEKANQVYEKWIENSLKKGLADMVLVYEEKDILGFITLTKKGTIPLVGVDKRARGKGIAKVLVNASISQFKKWGVEKVEIETQIINIPAIRAYQACGFRIVDSHLTFSWNSKGL